MVEHLTLTVLSTDYGLRVLYFETCNALVIRGLQVRLLSPAQEGNTQQDFHGLRILFWIQKFEVCGSNPSRPLDVKRFL